MFDATRSKFPQIQFEKINVDQGDPRIAQYKVSGIPHVVFLDNQNKEVGGSTWDSPESFGQMVK